MSAKIQKLLFKIDMGHNQVYLRLKTTQMNNLSEAQMRINTF